MIYLIDLFINLLLTWLFNQATFLTLHVKELTLPFTLSPLIFSFLPIFLFSLSHQFLPVFQKCSMIIVKALSHQLTYREDIQGNIPLFLPNNDFLVTVCLVYCVLCIMFGVLRRIRSSFQAANVHILAIT